MNYKDTFGDLISYRKQRYYMKFPLVSPLLYRPLQHKQCSPFTGRYSDCGLCISAFEALISVTSLKLTSLHGGGIVTELQCFLLTRYKHLSGLKSVQMNSQAFCKLKTKAGTILKKNINDIKISLLLQSIQYDI